MKITYTLEEKDIKEILSDYMKQKYHIECPNVTLKQEIREGYGINEGIKSKIIIAKISEF